MSGMSARMEQQLRDARMKRMDTPSYNERDLAHSHRDENSASNIAALPPGKGAIRRSFSWGKKRKTAKEKKQVTKPPPVPVVTEVYAVTIDRNQADTELGLEMHITGDVIVSYVGPTIDGIAVGDTVLCIHGQQVHGQDDEEGDGNNLELARYLMKEPDMEMVELTIEKNTLRTEIIKRHAALRGTSLDKIGLTLVLEDEHVVVTGLEGLAAKSGRIAIGDKLVAINQTPVNDLGQAVGLLSASDLGLEVELEFLYGFIPPADHEFDAACGEFLPVVAKKGPGIVRRSLSFGKKKKKAREAEQATPREHVQEPIPELNFEPRMLSIPKNAEGRICVTFKIHDITNELMIGLVGEGSPAAMAGVEVGDRVLALGAKATGCEFFDNPGGLEDIEVARQVLIAAEHEPEINMVVQTRMRTEIAEFGYSPNGFGGPKDYLGLSFYSFEGDASVRITGITGPAEKANRFGLGDRIVAVNGIRVNHAKTLSNYIKAASDMGAPAVEFEVALGYQKAEGLWYGEEVAAKDDEDKPRKAKRSFSFGRKPKH